MPRALTDKEVAELKARICRAAEKLFATQGVAGVTMRELAVALGLSPMTPYRYFEDRDAILAAVRASAFSRFASRLERAIQGGASPLRRTTAMGKAYLGFALKEPDAYRLIFDLTQPDESKYPELVKQSQRARSILARQVQDLIEAGLVPSQPQQVGYALWSVSHGVCVLHLAGKYPGVKDCRQAFAATMTWLFQGFESQLRRESRTTPRRKGSLHAITQA